MKCNICGKEINEINGDNNPYPVCGQDDFESRCCNVCNDLVIIARVVQSSFDSDKTLEVGKTIIIFFADNSNKPIEFLSETGKFLTGVIEDLEVRDKLIIVRGTWGNFEVTSNDNYCIFTI